MCRYVPCRLWRHAIPLNCLSCVLHLGYELPVVCQDMHKEVEEIIKEHHLVTNRHKHWTGFHFDALVPRYPSKRSLILSIYVEPNLPLFFFAFLCLL